MNTQEGYQPEHTRLPGAVDAQAVGAVALRVLGEMPGDQSGGAVSATEQPTFVGLHERAEVEKTLEMFGADRLLARAVEDPYFSRETGLDFEVYEKEFSYMAEGGMQHVSTTLIVPEAPIRVYKSTGFLVDSNTVTIEHIAKSDSGSRTDRQGNLQANAADFTTLADLADDARAEHTREMNEVNVNNLDPDAVRGLFSVSGPAAPMLTMLAAQRRLEAVGHGTLPLFLYDQEHGGLVEWHPTTEDVHGLLEKLPQRIKPLYEQGLGLLSESQQATV